MNHEPGQQQSMTESDIINALAREMAETKGHVLRIDSAVGNPETVIPGMFPGDPPRVIPARGYGLTLHRLASADARRNRHAIFSASTISLVLTLAVQAIAAWRGNAAPPPPPMKPAIVEPSTPTIVREAPKTVPVKL